MVRCVLFITPPFFIYTAVIGWCIVFCLLPPLLHLHSHRWVVHHVSLLPLPCDTIDVSTHEWSGDGIVRNGWPVLRIKILDAQCFMCGAIIGWCATFCFYPSFFSPTKPSSGSVLRFVCTPAWYHRIHKLHKWSHHRLMHHVPLLSLPCDTSATYSH